MRDILIHFLDRIKEYEHESGHSMHEDERESSEIVDIHLEAHHELKNNGDLGDVSKRFLSIQHYPEMKHNIDDVIEIPNEEWKHADGTYCDVNYFRAYPEFFKEI